MMKHGLLVLASMLATPAIAQTYHFSATGTAGQAYSVDQNFNSISTPATALKAGDTVSVSFDFNASSFAVSSFYDADPTVNIYYGSVFNYRFQFGSYVDEVSGPITFASSQLWNNRVVTSNPIDSFSIGTLADVASSKSPLVYSNSSTVNENFGFSAYDNSGTARNSDLISEEPPLSAYDSQSAFVGYLDPNTYSQTVYSLFGLQASLTALPEPGTWAMMILGMGAIGFAMRRNRARAHVEGQPAAIGRM